MGNRFDNVQVLRGVACLLVAVYHASAYEAVFRLSFSPLRPVQWFGYAGVDLFFVVSGFIIATTSRADLGRAARLPGYLFRRLWRIYPAYWAALALAVAVHVYLNPWWTSIPGWSADLRNRVLLLPRPDLFQALPVLWTLSFELMFYLGFAVLFLLPRRMAGLALIGWAVAVVAALSTGTFARNTFDAHPLSPFVLEFLAGCLIAWVSISLTGRAAVGLLAAAAAWVGVGIATTAVLDPVLMTYQHGLRVLVFGVPAALVVLAAVGWERGGGRLGWRWLGRVGDASYSIYLVHAPALVLTTHLTLLAGWSHDRSGHLAWLALMLTVAVVPGMLFYRFVERPLVGLWKRKRKPAVAPAAEAPPRLAA